MDPTQKPEWLVSTEKHSCMSNDVYYTTLGYLPEAVKENGGQELILADIMACLHDCESIYLPFNCPSLEVECENQGIDVVPSVAPEGFDAIYWGTPTIVQNKALFASSVPARQTPIEWTVKRERETSRDLTKFAKNKGAKKIITGLGTGDITVIERLVDMGGGHVVSYKNFGEFEDWVLVRDL